MVTIIKITKGNKNKFLQRKYTSFISKRQHLHNYVKLERLNVQKIQNAGVDFKTSVKLGANTEYLYCFVRA